MNNNKNAQQGVALMIFAAVVIAFFLAMQFVSFIQHSSKAPSATNTAIIQDIKTNTAADDCEIVIRYNEPGSEPERRQPDGKPLVITSRMENALISVPLGTAIDFTTTGIGAKKVVLKNYDNTAFDYARLPNGFRLTVRTDIPEGRARTTDISVDDKQFYLEFAFTHACN